MKKLLYLLAAVLIINSLKSYSQEQDIDYLDVVLDSTVYKRESGQKPLKKLQVNTQAGMGYSFSSAGYGGPFFTLSPHATYPLNNRFSLTAGISLGYGSFYNPYFIASGEDELLPMTRMYFFAGGSYKVNEKLTVNGSVYKQIIDVPNRNPNSNVNTNFDSKGGTIGFQYKLTPNITFGAQISVDDSPYYYPHNGYGNGFNNFGTSMFPGGYW